MLTAARPGRCLAVPRDEGVLAASEVLRVDTADCAPLDMARFATMNPFHFDASWRIPVPGTNRYSSSMESVWQGLKVVDGEVDLGMFDRRAVKRPPEEARGPGYDYAGSMLAFGDELIDLVSARVLIYLPAYLFVLDRLVPAEVVDEIVSAVRAGRDVVFYDWDDTFDIRDPRSSFSHSAVLAAWFGGSLDEEFLPAYRELAGSGAPLELGRYRALHGSKEGSPR